MPGAPSPDTTTTDQLIEACLRGDQSAWDAIVQRYWRKAFNVGYTFVGRHEEAEDLTQEIFLKVFKALDTFDRRANFQTWLVSISRNVCIRMWDGICESPFVTHCLHDLGCSFHTYSVESNSFFVDHLLQMITSILGNNASVVFSVQFCL